MGTGKGGFIKGSKKDGWDQWDEWDGDDGRGRCGFFDFVIRPGWRQIASHRSHRSFRAVISTFMRRSWHIREQP